MTLNDLENILRKLRPHSVVATLDDGQQRRLAVPAGRKWSRLVRTVDGLGAVASVELRDQADAVLGVWTAGEDDEDDDEAPRLTLPEHVDLAGDDEHLKFLRILQEAEDRSVDRTLRAVAQIQRGQTAALDLVISVLRVVTDRYVAAERQSGAVARMHVEAIAAQAEARMLASGKAGDDAGAASDAALLRVLEPLVGQLPALIASQRGAAPVSVASREVVRSVLEETGAIMREAAVDAAAEVAEGAIDGAADAIGAAAEE